MTSRYARGLEHATRPQASTPTPEATPEVIHVDVEAGLQWSCRSCPSRDPRRRRRRRLGADTEAAVKEHQQSEGLGADGIAGPDTLATLGLWNHITVAEGSRGNVVKKVQAALGIGADGVFGAGTKKAVMAFRKEKGIVADGVVGPATLHHLNIME